MLVKYYVGIRPQTSDCHAVHKEGCPFLLEADKRISLGTYNSPDEAVSEGRRHFDKSDYCLFCSKEYHSPKEDISTEIPVPADLLSSEQLHSTWESALHCSAN